MTRRLVLCSCEGSQRLDAEGLAAATGLETGTVCDALCTRQIGRAAEAIARGDAIACEQERATFEALAEEAGVAMPQLIDLRDRAGWTDDAAPTLPKQAALIAEAQLEVPATRAVDVTSHGVCLVIGPRDAALDAAERLAPHLAVTVLLDADPELPERPPFDVIAGRLRGATGTLGAFRVRIDALRQMDPGGRGVLRLGGPRDGAVSECDLILDLTGGTSLFPAPAKRDGYLRADPGRPEAVAAAVLEASHAVGTFEKPLHVRLEPLLCAHSRAGQVGCTRCLDLCPTGAITPAGEHVSIDPLVCAGCGSCSAACPSGAISFDAPPVETTFRRVQTLATAYRAAGGTAPRLLAVDAHGMEMVRLAARFGPGLPADTIPVELEALNAFGHAEAMAALAAGFAQVLWLPGPHADRAALEAQVMLTSALAAPGAAVILDETDPEAMAARLHGDVPPAPVAAPVRPMGTRRQIARQAAQGLHGTDGTLPLPEGAPYGAVLVDTKACTLCLACVSLCPSGALGDNPDRPQLRFQEDACLQCGICATVCPEDAIALEPRMDLAPAAFEQRILYEEEPAACVECGALFGVASTIERVAAKLEGHPMFAGTDKARQIRMCDDCRVQAQVLSADNPFRGPERPRPRTTEDELRKRTRH
ncbi:4Fe-4S binding protein [Jannaschia sp. W003]|uniref:4Fe-4S binding protein n=1 Tax=Jannaschia sp. W003 TaxID=2867012 RepID=UPI0021A4BFA5|nr:4Fe-4S binding protein [Jannaschia sp. W003]UWQ21477.1 4Fe-4S binding protein [Jannaschia sp. W003]